jgi:hypothetical protein
MAEQENPRRQGRPVTVEDIRQLMGASTPHFALHVRNRIRKLISGLPFDVPARRLGEQEIARLERLAYTGETRGTDAQEGERPLPALNEDALPRRVGGPTRG